MMISKGGFDVHDVHFDAALSRDQKHPSWPFTSGVYNTQCAGRTGAELRYQAGYNSGRRS